MFRNLFKGAKLVRLKPDGTNYQIAAGTTDTLTSDALDTDGYTGVSIVTAYGALTGGAVTTQKVQQSSDDAATDAYSDLLGTSQAPADTDDNKVFISDFHKPQKRYLKVVITRATANAAIDGLFALLYNAGNEPVTQSSNVGGVEFFNGCKEGVA